MTCRYLNGRVSISPDYLLAAFKLPVPVVGLQLLHFQASLSSDTRMPCTNRLSDCLECKTRLPQTWVFVANVHANSVVQGSKGPLSPVDTFQLQTLAYVLKDLEVKPGILVVHMSMYSFVMPRAWHSMHIVHIQHLHHSLTRRNALSQRKNQSLATLLPLSKTKTEVRS